MFPLDLILDAKRMFMQKLYLKTMSRLQAVVGITPSSVSGNSLIEQGPLTCSAPSSIPTGATQLSATQNHIFSASALFSDSSLTSCVLESSSVSTPGADFSQAAVTSSHPEEDEAAILSTILDIICASDEHTDDHIEDAVSLMTEVTPNILREIIDSQPSAPTKAKSWADMMDEDSDDDEPLYIPWLNKNAKASEAKRLEEHPTQAIQHTLYGTKKLDVISIVDCSHRMVQDMTQCSSSWADIMDDEDDDGEWAPLPWVSTAKDAFAMLDSLPRASDLTDDEQSDLDDDVASVVVATIPHADFSEAHPDPCRAEKHLLEARLSLIDLLAEYDDKTHNDKIWVLGNLHRKITAAHESSTRRKVAQLHGAQYWLNDGKSLLPELETKLECDNKAANDATPGPGLVNDGDNDNTRLLPSSVRISPLKPANLPCLGKTGRAPAPEKVYEQAITQVLHEDLDISDGKSAKKEIAEKYIHDLVSFRQREAPRPRTLFDELKGLLDDDDDEPDGDDHGNTKSTTHELTTSLATNSQVQHYNENKITEVAMDSATIIKELAYGDHSSSTVDSELPDWHDVDVKGQKLESIVRVAVASGQATLDDSSEAAEAVMAHFCSLLQAAEKQQKLIAMKGANQIPLSTYTNEAFVWAGMESSGCWTAPSATSSRAAFSVAAQTAVASMGDEYAQGAAKEESSAKELKNDEMISVRWPDQITSERASPFVTYGTAAPLAYSKQEVFGDWAWDESARNCACEECRAELDVEEESMKSKKCLCFVPSDSDSVD